MKTVGLLVLLLFSAAGIAQRQVTHPHAAAIARWQALIPENRESSSDALRLLSDVSARYAQANSYRIEATEERTFNNELSRSWQKTLMTAVVAPGGRYRYEGRSGHGSAILVSDGKTKWVLHLTERLYTQKPVADPTPPPRAIPQEEYSVNEAKRLASDIGSLAKRLKSATLISEETVEINGRHVACQVLRYTEDDLKTKSPDLKREETIWIDKSRHTIVKRASRMNTYVIMPGSRARLPEVMEVTTIYSVVELDQEQPEFAFTFTAPSDATLVETFPDPFAPRNYDVNSAQFVGKRAPEVQLQSTTGKITTLSTFRGRPLFIDFWATSCAPCTKAMPDLQELYTETAPKGLAWISIDSDDDPDNATRFLTTNKIPWENYHDSDGLAGKALGREGIPLGVLIDPDGVVRFWKTAYTVSELKEAISKLSPEFSSVAPSQPPH